VDDSVITLGLGIQRRAVRHGDESLGYSRSRPGATGSAKGGGFVKRLVRFGLGIELRPL